MTIIDPNMETALKWAKELGKVATLPQSLKDVDKRANLVQAINSPNFGFCLEIS